MGLRTGPVPGAASAVRGADAIAARMKTNPTLDSLRAAWRFGLLSIGLFTANAVAGPVAVQDLAGRYEGAWANTTFGSTGKAVIGITIAGTNALINFDMDGAVFGAGDPPPIEMPGTVKGDTIVIANNGVGIFGDVTGVIDAAAGTFSATLTNIPGGFIQRVVATGTIQAGRMDLNYTVDFPGAASPTNPAHGVMGVAALPPLRISRADRDGDSLVLEWTGGKGPYQVQMRNGLATGSWVNVGSATSDLSAKVPLGQAQAGFFRISGQ